MNGSKDGKIVADPAVLDKHTTKISKGLINSSLNSYRQSSCDGVVTNKLHSVKPVLGEWLLLSGPFAGRGGIS